VYKPASRWSSPTGRRASKELRTPPGSKLNRDLQFLGGTIKLLSKIGLIIGVMLLAMAPCWADIVSISGTGAGTVSSNQSITFTDFTGNPYPASVATANIVGGAQTLTFGYVSPPDFVISGDGDRLILLLTNTTGHTLTDLAFALTGGTFCTQSPTSIPGIPSSGTFASNTLHDGAGVLGQLPFHVIHGANYACQRRTTGVLPSRSEPR